jgi:predicted O-methyltransferase YrrM
VGGLVVIGECDLSHQWENFENVRVHFEHLEYMTHAQATYLRDFIVERDARDILEIGFYHGKSSAYIGAVLEDLNRGHLVTIDKRGAHTREPNIETVLAKLGLSDRVTPLYAPRSYTWEMKKLIASKPRPQFDLCYFDGDHSWDGTGFGFVLVDMLLRPGGWIIFDDLKWTMQAAMERSSAVPSSWRGFTEDERAEPAVKIVFDMLVPRLGYVNLHTAQRGWWGIAQKPMNAEQQMLQSRGLLGRLRNALLPS